MSLGSWMIDWFCGGYLFTLAKYPRADQNQQYLIEAADYRMRVVKPS